MLNKTSVAVAVAAVAACVLLLGACTDKNQASETNFKDAINETFKTRMPCLQIAGYFHEDEGISLAMEPTFFTDAQMIADRPLPKALADLGLIILRVERKKTSLGTNVPYLRVTFTDKGMPYFRDLRDRVDEMPSLCFGHYVLDSVDRFTIPTPADGRTLSDVSYTYHVDGLPDWTQDPNLLAHSDWLKKFVANPRHAELTTFVQTNKGWEPVGRR